jgi:exosortase/archaeosortase family protein
MPIRLNIEIIEREYKKRRYLYDVLLFVIITLAAHNLWWYSYKQFSSLVWVNQIMDSLVDLLFAHSKIFISFLYPVSIKGTTFLFPENGYIEINQSCSGFKQYYQIIFLFILFPGPWKHKIWFIPVSIIIIHLVNVFRIIALSLVLTSWPGIWDFMHDWILRPFFYLVIFGLWLFWNEKIRRKENYHNLKQAEINSGN